MSLQQPQHVAAQAFLEASATPTEQASLPVDAHTKPTEAEIRSILALTKRMRRSATVRQIVRTVIEQKSCSAEEIALLIATLQNPSEKFWRERTAAAWALGRQQLGPEQRVLAAQTLCKVLEDRELSAGQRFVGRFPRAIARSTLWALCFGLLTALVFPVTDIKHSPWLLVLAVGLVIAALLFGSPLIMLLSFDIDADRMDELRSAAATALGRLCVPESVGVLAKAVLDKKLGARKAAKPALHAALPTLTADWYGQLDLETVPNLCRILGMLTATPAEEALGLRILEALERVGDGRAVPSVQRITTTGRPARFWVKASRALPILIARQRQENAREMLLRASAATSVPETLLRPSSAHITETPPDQLLRPHAPR